MFSLSAKKPTKKTPAYLIRDSRDSTLVHEEEVHPLHILPPSPSPLYHWLTVCYSIQPHLTSDNWGHCRGTTHSFSDFN